MHGGTGSALCPWPRPSPGAGRPPAPVDAIAPVFSRYNGASNRWGGQPPRCDGGAPLAGPSFMGPGSPPLRNEIIVPCPCSRTVA